MWKSHTARLIAGAVLLNAGLFIGSSRAAASATGDERWCEGPYCICQCCLVIAEKCQGCPVVC
jgi:hypothetical protein